MNGDHLTHGHVQRRPGVAAIIIAPGGQEVEMGPRTAHVGPIAPAIATALIIVVEGPGWSAPTTAPAIRTLG